MSATRHAAGKLIRRALALPLGHVACCWLAWLSPVSFGSPTDGLAEPVAISEIMYHPVEEPAFATNGSPALDLTAPVHEYLELQNYGEAPVALIGWAITGGVRYWFTNAIVLSAGDCLVVAKDPDRLLRVSAYQLPADKVLGPWEGQLGNEGETLTLWNASGHPVDTVTYSRRFPWPISADGLGVEQAWLAFPRTNYQYRGRSLERVSCTWPAIDPANWLARPTPLGPSPGRDNAMRLAVPKPVVLGLYTGQAADGNATIRKQNPVRVQCLFSSTVDLSNVRLEYFLDDPEKTNESTILAPMLPLGNLPEGRYAVDLPGQPDRTLVRYRIRADRGEGDEVVSPRNDDPFGWHAYFVSPMRTGATPAYDLLVSTRSLAALSTNIGGGPLASGRPRASWDATEPAVFVADAVVYDVRVRYHGSIYLRSAARKSFHLEFPRYRTFCGRSTLLLSDKDATTQAGHAIFREAGLPIPLVSWIDLYLNNQSRLRRLQMEVYDEPTMNRFAREQVAQGLGPAVGGPGDLYKSQGSFDTLGPYGPADGQRLRGSGTWTALQRYEYSYGLMFRDWIGYNPLTNMIDAMWLARSNRVAVPRTNEVAELRQFIATQWDLDKMLTYVAVINWMCAWDDTIHNYYLWRQIDGRWALLPWDFDGLMTGALSMGFKAPPSGGNYFKQSLIAAYREEYRQRAWWLNNTLLQPDHLLAIGVSNQFSSFAATRLAAVNKEAALGAFPQPKRPVNLTPANRESAGPFSWLRASKYAYTTNPASAHAATAWSIRHAAGSYYEPAFALTSAGQREELPLPASALEPGETYYWRCAYIDQQGHPSIPSQETPFVYAKPSLKPDSLVLNEVMADNRSSVANAGQHPDWIELYNRAGQERDLGGYCLTDDLLEPVRFRFPPRTTIPAHGFVVVWCDREAGAPGLHAGFGLSAQGETLALFAPSTNGLVLVDVLRFGLQLPDVSIGRTPNGTGTWSLNVPTPNAANVPQPVANSGELKLNEWMANPVSGDGWIELYNPERLPASLEGLCLTDDLANPTNHAIAALSFVPARGYATLVADAAPKKGAGHLGFRLRPQGGALGLLAGDGSARDLVLYGRQPPGISTGRVPDGAPTFYSLRAAASPGRSNVLDSDGDGMPDDWELLQSLNPLSGMDAAADSDGDGVSNLAEYWAGTDPHDRRSCLQLEATLTGGEGGTSLVLRFLAAPGKTYTVEYRESFEAYPWRRLTDVAAQPGPRWIEIADTPEGPLAARFYRLVTPRVE